MAKVYIVQGSTGEYSDYNEWMVLGYHDKYRAELHAHKANERNNQLTDQERAMYDSPEFKAISAYMHSMSPPPEYDWDQRNAWYRDEAHPERQAANDAYTKYWDDWHFVRGSDKRMNELDPTYERRTEWQNWPTNYVVVDVEVAE